jgi:hypothetical protein
MDGKNRITLIIWLRSGNVSSNKFFHLYMLQQKLEDFFFFFFYKINIFTTNIPNEYMLPTLGKTFLEIKVDI